MSLTPRMNFHPFKSPDRSWGMITSIVVAVHCLLIGLSLLLDSPTPVKQQKAPARLVVQTVDLTPSNSIAVAEKTSVSQPIDEIEDDSAPEPEPKLIPVAEEKVQPKKEPEPKPKQPEPPKEVAFASSPLPPNPIKKNPIPPTPIEKKPIPKREDQIKTPPKQVAPPTPPPPVTPTPPAPAAQPKSTTPVKTPKPVEKPPVKTKPAPAKPQDRAKPKETTPKPAPAKTPPKAPTVDKKAEKAAADKTAELKKQQEADKAAELKKKQEADKAAEQKKKQEAEAAAKKIAAEQLAEQERQHKLLADAQERIAKIAGSRDKVTPNKAGTSSLADLPNAITSLQVDTLPVVKGGLPLSQREVFYRDELAGRLKLLLRLPEYGDVKVNLTLDRAGKVVKVVIVNAESTVNRKYIEKTLPTLSLPAFGTNFESATEYTFSITLSNEL